MRAAPTIDMFLMMPIMRNPPLYTIHDLKTWVTLSDVLDAHEILTLEAAHAEKAELARGNK
jgi:hypothetical protein